MMRDPDAEFADQKDELAIRRQIARFADAAMANDGAAFSSLFTTTGECVFEPPADVHRVGREQIAALLQTLRSGQDFFVQYAQPGLITVDGDEATARTLCYEIARGPGEHYYRNHGMFFDRLVRTSEGWLFAVRRYYYLWLDTSPFSGQPFPQLDILAQHGAARLRSAPAE